MPIRPQSSQKFFLGIICALLVLFTATIQVVHHHETIGASHSDCALCLVAHTSIAPYAPVVIPVPAERTEEVEIPARLIPRNTFVFLFYSRPPPAESASL
jgi:hypothetical protein